jgi:hypothetical protein
MPKNNKLRKVPVTEDSYVQDVLHLPRLDELVMTNIEGEVELQVEPGDW